MADKKQPKQPIVQELRALDEQALQSKIAELKQQLVEQHRAHAAQELPGVHVIGKTRKQIAVAHTILAEKRATEQPKEKEN
ncbi:MAG TPA: 50S ribosomal protein L29 [Candidatus Saccharimonadales bacterium]|nr:50S ribosomal protein L29 [Candidatus Saccharimonadales bacterium]